jgi:uncharacterized membrane protein YecN with MAPEG domain
LKTGYRGRQLGRLKLSHEVNARQEPFMTFSITAPYAALLALLYIVLVGLVGAARKGNPALGPGDETLLIADRRHMNFVENVPFALLLIAFVEAGGAAKGWVHALCIVLLISRLVHPFGLDPARMKHPARGIGAGGTLLVMLAAALTLLWQAVR